MNEKRFKIGEEQTFILSDAAFEGKCVARVDNFVVFVNGAVPGDTVRARIVKSKQQYAEAQTIEVVNPSPFRIIPRCKHFGVCGGCKWQNLDYSKQLEYKRQHVIDALKHIGGLPDVDVLPTIPAAQIYFYRNKMEYSFAALRWLTSDDMNKEDVVNNDGPYLGLHVPQRYDKVLDIEACHLQSEASNQILTFSRAFARGQKLSVYNSDKETGYLRFLVIRQSAATGEIMVNFVTHTYERDIIEDYARKILAKVPSITTIVNTINAKKAQIAFGDEEHIIIGSGTITETIGNHQFTISSSSFLQTNSIQAAKLYEVAKQFAELQSTDVVYDLYCGAGAISIFISDNAKAVLGIDVIESAIENAKQNAERNGISNCMFLLGDLKDLLTKEIGWMKSVPIPDVVMLDPPRSGVHPKALDSLLKINPERIVYISCNPTTQARDLKTLCQNQYKIVKSQPVDMFPHTYHIENVVLLHRV
jgi:23S rRNA (uracil1939-C5)-methyltransferase